MVQEVIRMSNQEIEPKPEDTREQLTIRPGQRLTVELPEGSGFCGTTVLPSAKRGGEFSYIPPEGAEVTVEKASGIGGVGSG